MRERDRIAAVLCTSPSYYRMTINSTQTDANTISSPSYHCIVPALCSAQDFLDAQLGNVWMLRGEALPQDLMKHPEFYKK